jgi:hypothetical protein
VTGRRADALGAAVPAAEQDDAAEVAAGHEGVEARAARAVVEADHEQLSCALVVVHARQDARRARRGC